MLSEERQDDAVITDVKFWNGNVHVLDESFVPPCFDDELEEKGKELEKEAECISFEQELEGYLCQGGGHRIDPVFDDDDREDMAGRLQLGDWRCDKRPKGKGLKLNPSDSSRRSKKIK